MSKAIYPGSFDPLTFGHIDIIERASKIFDEVTVVVLNNSQKNHLFSAANRVSMIQDIVAGNGFKNVSVDISEGLLVDYAKENKANVVIRGLRAITDFEYELQIAQVNRVQLPGLETIFLTTSLDYSYLSSTIVREFAKYKGDIRKFLPESVAQKVEAKFAKKEL